MSKKQIYHDRQTDRQTDRWINEWRGRMREGGRVVEVGKDEIEAVVGSNMISLCPLPRPPSQREHRCPAPGAPQPAPLVWGG